MTRSKISYCITTHNETRTLKNLLERISSILASGDEILIVDDYSTNPETLDIINPYNVIKHNLKQDYGKDYAKHKNIGNEHSKGDWILQCDADELPTLILLYNIQNIIETYPDFELFYIPRINDYRGVTPEIARQWDWKLKPAVGYEHRPIVQWPDPQGRLFRNSPHIKWCGKLHETITGYSKCVCIPPGDPPDEELAIYHDSTIEEQIQHNIGYQRDFTEVERRGISNKKA